MTTPSKQVSAYMREMQRKSAAKRWASVSTEERKSMMSALAKARWDKRRATLKRLEEIRKEIRAERISYGELSELQSLVAFIAPGDVELLETAGVPEKK